MEITVNNDRKETTENVLLQTIVDETLGDKQKGVAVAVNDTVVPRELWASIVLKPHDSILIIKATQGG